MDKQSTSWEVPLGRGCEGDARSPRLTNAQPCICTGLARTELRNLGGGTMGWCYFPLNALLGFEIANKGHMTLE